MSQRQHREDRKVSVALRALVLREADLHGHLVDEWNRLPVDRGVQADLYDSHAWLSSWVKVVSAGTLSSLRIPAVMDDGKPVALAPMIEKRARQWEAIGVAFRPRYRPVIGTEEPDEAILEMLAEQIARADARILKIPGLPSRDPVTQALVSGLRRAGYHVSLREASRDCLTVVKGDWAQHRRRFHSFERMVKKLAKKAKRIGDISFEVYASEQASLQQGYELYLGVHAQSWKGPLKEPMAGHRRELLKQTGPLGWPRVFVMKVSGVPVAAHIWFLVGKVAMSYSTVYDRRMPALGPGSVLHWHSQECVFTESQPALIDHLPGRGPQKDKLGPDHYPLQYLEATRKAVLYRLTCQGRNLARRWLPASVRRLVSRHKDRTRQKTGTRCVGSVQYQPGDGGLPVSPLDTDARMEMYLTVAGMHNSVKAMKDLWHEGDTWWRIGDETMALVRLGVPEDAWRSVREIILIGNQDSQVARILASLAAETGDMLQMYVPDEQSGNRGTPTPVHSAALPFPGL